MEETKDEAHPFVAGLRLLALGVEEGLGLVEVSLKRARSQHGSRIRGGRRT